MRILFSSNAPWCNTGYGVQAKSLLPRLGALPVVGGPENIGIFAWFGLAGGVTQVGPFKMYPGFADPYGNDMIGHHSKDFRADVVITLIDVWTQKDTANRVAPAAWVPWFPIDADPVPSVVLDSIAQADPPVVYSRFAEDLLRKEGIECAYIPHGIEPDIFRPLQPFEVQQFRRQVFGDALHVSSIVAANKGVPDRKAFQVQLRAWKAFAADKPTARLYVHTDPLPQAGGLDLVEMVRVLGISDKVIFPDRYQYYMGYPPEYLALVYNASDVVLAASMSEGFGIPIIEAQACGTPVITTKFASMPELCLWGAAIEPADLFWSYLGSWWAWPDHAGITGAMEAMFAQSRTEPELWREQGHNVSETIHALYGWDVVANDYWRPLLEDLA